MRTPELEIEHFRRVAEAMRASPSWTNGSLFEGHVMCCTVIKGSEPRGIGYWSGWREPTERQLREAARKGERLTMCHWAATCGEINASDR